MVGARIAGPHHVIGVLGAVLVWTCLPAGPALAGADCSITAASANFGTYDALLAQPDDSTASVTVTCNYVPPGATNVAYTVSASNGFNGTSATTRAMASGTSRLSYNVYVDAARSQVLGTGTGGTVVAQGSMTIGPGIGNGTRTATHTFYGRVPQAQDTAPGAYSDTLVLTLTY
ncbi:MAG TPA: spore coat U domain-containing protein [Steroidobacteraceae bacterium]